MRESHETLPAFRERLANARGKLLSREPFLGFLALELPTLIIESSDSEVQTAATDGRHYFYNYLWCRQLTDPELVFVVAHEVAHVMFLHAGRRGGRDRQLWNAACDYAINGILLTSTTAKGALVNVAAMPAEIDAITKRTRPIGLYDERFANLPAEVIYDQLTKQGQEVGDNWDRLLDPSGDGEATASVAQSRAAVAKALIRTKDFRKRRGQGDEASLWERWADHELRGTVRWQDRFRQQILGWGGDELSWRRPNRKYQPLGLYLPRYRGYQLPNLIFALDTSGSVSDRFLGRMVGELNQLLLSARNSVVRLVCCDTQLQVIGDFTSTRRLDPRTQPLRGGGGTDFRPVFEFARTQQSFRHVVFLTDAEGLFPEAPPRDLWTLWLIPENAEVTVPFGDVITLPIDP